MLSKYKAIAILVAVLATCAGVHALLRSGSSGTTADTPAGETKAEETPKPETGKTGSVLIPARSKTSAGLKEVGADTSVGSTLLKLVFSLALILALIAGCAFAIKKFFPASRRLFRSEGLEVMGRTYIAPKQSVCLLRVGKRILVLGCTPDRISALSEITDQAEIDAVGEKIFKGSPTSASATFARIFKKKNLGYDDGFSDMESRDVAEHRTVQSELERLKTVGSEGT